MVWHFLLFMYFRTSYMFIITSSTCTCALIIIIHCDRNDSWLLMAYYVIQESDDIIISLTDTLPECRHACLAHVHVWDDKCFKHMIWLALRGTYAIIDRCGIIKSRCRTGIYKVSSILRTGYRQSVAEPILVQSVMYMNVYVRPYIMILHCLLQVWS